MFFAHKFMLRDQMGMRWDINPFDIIPYLVYIIFSPESWTIVANNRTIFTYLIICQTKLK